MSRGKEYKKDLFDVKKKRISVDLFKLNSKSKPAKKGTKSKPSSVNYKKNRSKRKG